MDPRRRPSLAARLPLALVALGAAAPLAAADPAAATAGQGQNFSSELALLYRVVACSDDPAVTVPEAWQKTVDAHCADLRQKMASFRTRYVEKATPFFANLRPAGVPTSVVYPFGGGDLASALVAYPDALEITTISLEYAGDPTQMAGLSATQLRGALADFRSAVSGLLALHDSATEKMQAVQRGPLPGQVSFFLTAVSVFGYKPVSLRYFKLEDDGSLHYYTAEEIAQLSKEKAQKLKTWTTASDDSVAFSNSELIFTNAAGQKVVHRHIAFNLDDAHFKGSPLEKYLDARGPIVAITKAASYLLWNGSFSGIRDYLARNAVFMVSDSTGIPPVYAHKAGLKQTTYGRFTGAYLQASETVGQQFIDLWAKQRYRRLPFRFGYPDAAGNYHMLVTERAQN